MKAKSITSFIFSFAILFSILDVSAYANNNSYSKLADMSDYDYYCTFAKALKGHDSLTLSMFINCCSENHGYKEFKNGHRPITCIEANCKKYKQFDSLKSVKISNYSIKIIKLYDVDNYDEFRRSSGMRNAAKITLTIDKSDHILFPEGTHSYYAELSPQSGMFGTCIFRPYNQKDAVYSNRYTDLITACTELSYANGFKDASLKQLQNTAYDSNLVHNLFHSAFGGNDKYPDGITKKQLNQELKIFFGNSRDLSNDEISKLKKTGETYYKSCGHGEVSACYKCIKITRSKKTGDYTFDIWYYSDSAQINVCKKVKYTFSKKRDNFTIRKIDCYYDNKNSVFLFKGY